MKPKCKECDDTGRSVIKEAWNTSPQELGDCTNPECDAEPNGKLPPGNGLVL